MLWRRLVGPAARGSATIFPPPPTPRLRASLLPALPPSLLPLLLCCQIPLVLPFLLLLLLPWEQPSQSRSRSQPRLLTLTPSSSFQPLSRLPGTPEPGAALRLQGVSPFFFAQYIARFFKVSFFVLFSLFEPFFPPPSLPFLKKGSKKTKNL